MLWFQDLTEIIWGNLSNITRESKIKVREYFKDKNNELAMNRKNKNNRDLCRRRSFQPRSNLVKNDNGKLLADSHNISNR
jgi:hypothetical protein